MSFCFNMRLLTESHIQSNKDSEVADFTPWNKRIAFHSTGPLALARSLMIRVCGFGSHDEAKMAADHFWQALLLTGAKNVRGVSLEGIEILSQDRAFVPILPRLGVAQPPSQFANQLTPFIDKPLLKTAGRVGAELINEVPFHSSSETRFLLAIVAIETLCAPYKKKGENNTRRCQRIIRRDLDERTADAFSPLYTKRNDFAHEGKGKGGLDNEAAEARQIAIDLLLAQVQKGRV